MFEYKVIPAPARAEKHRGLKTTAERFAHVLTQAINAEAEAGWDYVRAETLPCEERKGLMGGTRTTTETVLVFRRAVATPEEAAAETPEEASATRSEPAAERREPVFRPDALSRAAAARRTEPRLRAHDGER
jgi:uncharacterized membrane protein